MFMEDVLDPGQVVDNPGIDSGAAGISTPHPPRGDAEELPVLLSGQSADKRASRVPLQTNVFKATG